MKLLFLGDIVGRAGVSFVKEKLWRIKKDNDIITKEDFGNLINNNQTKELLAIIKLMI